MFDALYWLKIDTIDLAKTLHSFHLLHVRCRDFYKDELPSFTTWNGRSKKIVRNVRNVSNNEKHDEQVEQLHDAAISGVVRRITFNGGSKKSENAWTGYSSSSSSSAKTLSCHVVGCVLVIPYDNKKNE